MLSSLYNLLHSSKLNWKQAATSGIVTHLKRLVERGGHPVTLAVPMMCEMVCGGGLEVRKQLWDQGAMPFLLAILTRESCAAFKVTILNSIYAWLLVGDTDEGKVEAVVAETKNVEQIAALLKVIRCPPPPPGKYQNGRTPQEEGEHPPPPKDQSDHSGKKRN